VAFWEGLIESITESGLGTGLLIAAGAVLAFPLVRPLLRETTKLVIKGGLIAYEQVNQASQTVGESMSDMVAEVQAEREGEGSSPAR
jgi:hypothetical protein